MKALTGMKNFSSLENKKLEKMGSIVGGIAGATNVRTTSESGPTGGYSGDTCIYMDGKLITTVLA